MSRQSNVELLRIVAMILIVAHHFVVHGALEVPVYCGSLTEVFNAFWCGLIGSFGKVGVHIFIIITGYFNILKDFRISKALNIYLKTICYASIIFILGGFLGKQAQFANVCDYWFIKNYLFLYLLTPLLNWTIKLLNKKQLDMILFLSILITFIPPLFCKFNLGHLGTFAVLYFIGAYYQIRQLNLSNKFYMTILGCTLFYLVYYLISNIGYNTMVSNSITANISLYSLFTFILAISIFNLFLNLKIENNNLINGIASSVFGVYLIHDNALIYPLIWNKLLSVSTYIDKTYFALYSLITVAGVFLVCVALDKILMKLLGKLIRNTSKYVDEKLHFIPYLKR